ncbi:hypothetical protein BDR26DRAFT_940977 [Obelidium mucronatum]|nr:hypothetical protein BDR26DRAFT_940977 [Obelidium mucronatum]
MDASARQEAAGSQSIHPSGIDAVAGYVCHFGAATAGFGVVVFIRYMCKHSDKKQITAPMNVILLIIGTSVIGLCEVEAGRIRSSDSEFVIFRILNSVLTCVIEICYLQFSFTRSKGIIQSMMSPASCQYTMWLANTFSPLLLSIQLIPSALSCLPNLSETPLIIHSLWALIFLMGFYTVAFDVYLVSLFLSFLHRNRIAGLESEQLEFELLGVYGIASCLIWVIALLVLVSSAIVGIYSPLLNIFKSTICLLLAILFWTLLATKIRVQEVRRRESEGSIVGASPLKRAKSINGMSGGSHTSLAIGSVSPNSLKKSGSLHSLNDDNKSKRRHSSQGVIVTAVAFSRASSHSNLEIPRVNGSSRSSSQSNLAPPPVPDTRKLSSQLEPTQPQPLPIPRARSLSPVPRPLTII